jgi:hypothetical protein
MPAQTPQWKPGPLDALLGAWTFEITQEGQTVMRGRAEFARVEGGAFLLQHVTADLLPTTPDVWRENSPFPIVTVIGVDDPSGGFSYLYADGRGVRRVYQMTLADQIWEIRGQAGSRFFQRFQAPSATTAGPSPPIGSAPRTARAGSATSTSDIRRLSPHE